MTSWHPLPDFASLARALEASWDARTAYRGMTIPGNPAFGQCYPTARVVQWFYPQLVIASGEVWTGTALEHHFWNVHRCGAVEHRIDLSWKQFPEGSEVRTWRLLGSEPSDDSAATQERCALLLRRVQAHLAGEQGS